MKNFRTSTDLVPILATCIESSMASFHRCSSRLQAIDSIGWRIIPSFYSPVFRFRAPFFFFPFGFGYSGSYFPHRSTLPFVGLGFPFACLFPPFCWGGSSPPPGFPRRRARLVPIPPKRESDPPASAGRGWVSPPSPGIEPGSPA
eukprot:scaffold241_cov340-Pavlova_lutheri.AAC.15